MMNEEKKTIAGIRKFLEKLLALVFLQEISGHIPVRRIKAIPIGTVMVLKKGAPTVIFVPLTASDIIGNKVHHRIAKTAPSNIRLLNKKDDSLDKKESKR